MPKITTHLSFDRDANEAAELYTSVFEDSAIKSVATMADAPSGAVEKVTIDLWGREFTLFSGGSISKFTPAISFLVACESKDEVKALWEKLSEDGTVVMELGRYPFSESYGWIQDRYGLSWQIAATGGRQVAQRITPMLMFVGDVCGKAEEAVNFYASVFGNSRVGEISRYPRNQEPDQAGTVMHASFTLEGQAFAAMDSARDHQFSFNEAISFMVHCASRQEIHYFREKLSAEVEQGSRLKDKYGISWQIALAME